MTTIIQCRQLDSVEVNTNGDFTAVFDKPIKLDPGDSVNVKSCFIDTKSQNTTDIVIQEDIEVAIHYGYYVTSHFNNFSQNTFAFNAGGTDTGITNDGNKYIACHSQAPAANQYVHYTSITFYSTDQTSKAPTWGDGYLEFTYEDETGATITKKVNIPSYLMGNPKKVKVVDVKLDFIALENSIANITLHKAYQVRQTTINDFSGIPIPTGQDIYAPIQDKHIVKIPKGSYTPNDMAELLSGQFQKASALVANDSFYNNDNTLLTTTARLAFENNEQLFFVNADGSYGGKAKASGDLTNYAVFCGTGNFSILYDGATNKFKIDSCHNPIRDDAGNSIIKGIQVPDPNDPSKQINKLVVQNTGIYITQFEPTGFWYDQLGFSDENLVRFNPVAINQNNLVGTAFQASNFVEGVHITGQYLGLDAIVPKTVTGNEGTTLVFPIASVITTTNNPIIAPNPSLGGGQSTGYYLVEVSGFPTLNDVFGENFNNPHVKAIVSRYYTVNSYTSAGSESDVPYINISAQPVYINQLKIRILTPSGSVAGDIEDDNTIFLQITKQQPLQPYVLPQIKNNKK